MKKIIPIILIQFLFYPIGYSQELKTNAIYYDKYNVPFKIEQKYYSQNDSLFFYFSHFWNGSFCIRTKKTQLNDTLIITDEYLSLFEDKSKLDTLVEMTTGYSIMHKMDSVQIFLSKDSEQLLDTTLKDTLNSFLANFFPAYQNKILLMKIDGKIKLNFDKMKIEETVKCYYLNGTLIKIEWIGKNNELYSRCECKNQSNSISCQYLNFRKNKLSPETIRIEKINWNKKATLINYSTEGEYIGKKILYKHHIYKLNIKTQRDGKFSSKIKYLVNDNVFNNLIINNLYNDLLYHNDLLFLDKYKKEKKKYNKKTTRYKYTFDNKMRILELKIFINKKLDERVEYSYK